MSVVYPTSLINERLTDVLNAIDDGPSAGSLQFLDSPGGNVLATFALGDPAGFVSNGVLQFSNLALVTDPSTVLTGVANAAQITDSLGTAWITGLTVGTASPGANFDILLSPTNAILAGQTISLTAATITGR